VGGGTEFTIIVRTLGLDNCWKADGQDLTVTGNIIEITPFDLHPDADRGCGEMVVTLAHESRFLDGPNRDVDDSRARPACPRGGAGDRHTSCCGMGGRRALNVPARARARRNHLYECDPVVCGLGPGLAPRSRLRLTSAVVHSNAKHRGSSKESGVRAIDDLQLSGHNLACILTIRKHDDRMPCARQLRPPANGWPLLWR
jgi:hypothetical protein